MKKTSITTLMTYVAILVAVWTVASGASSPGAKTIKLTAKKFEFSPAEIVVKKGEPVALEIASEDVKHGFTLPDFGIRVDIKPGAVNRVTFTPDKTGRFTFACDVFCGSGHEEMSGTLTVTD